MEVTQVCVRIERTINTGNYENLMFSLEQTVAVNAEHGNKEHKRAVRELVESTTALLEKEVNYGTSHLIEED